MSTTNVVNIEKPRGRQPGQRVQSLDYRAYKALRDFNFDAYQADREALIEAIIERLRDREIF